MGGVRLRNRCDRGELSPGSGSPVFTVEGKYTAKGWTEWTQGFQYGSALLQFDATGDERFLQLGRARTVEVMAPASDPCGCPRPWL